MGMDGDFSWMRGSMDDTHSPENKWNALLGTGTPEGKKKEAEDIQREFAKNGLQWRVEDAIKAGIHPLAALGFQGPQAQPVVVGDTGSPPPDPNSSFAATMGQGLSRAMMASGTRETRLTSQMQLASLKLDIEGKAIDNQIRASQLRQMNQTGPAMPSPIGPTGGMSGQGNFKVKPSEAISSSASQPAQQAGAINDYGYARTGSGGYIPVPSQDIKERIEDNLFHESTHFFRNNVLPNFGGGPTPPDPREYPLPKGYDHWAWSPIHQQFMPARRERMDYLPKFFKKFNRNKRWD